MTPSAFRALVERWYEREDRTNHRTAMLCTVIANAAPRKKGSAPFTVNDFWVKRSRGDKESEATERRQSQEQMAAILKGIGRPIDDDGSTETGVDTRE